MVLARKRVQRSGGTTTSRSASTSTGPIPPITSRSARGATPARARRSRGVEAQVGLRALFERLPDLRLVPDAPLDFAPLAMLPIRLSMPVTWTPPT